MMKLLKQLLFAAAVTICFSLTASAQKGGDDKRPKNPDPPKIIVKDKDRDKDKPKGGDRDNRNNDNRGKKPQSYFNSSNEE